MEHQGRVVILRTTDFGEADRLVTFFSEGSGRLRGVAKNAKRSARRFGGGLEPGTIGTARYIERQGSDLVRLEEITVEFPAWRVTSSLPRVLALHISLEIADKTLPIGQASPARFGLITRWISFLSDNEPAASHRHAFYYKWLSASGLAPVFEKCVVCGRAPSCWDADLSLQSRGVGFISASHGGIVCNACRHYRGDKIISAELLEYLQGLKKGKISNAEHKEADDVFEHLLEHAVGGRLKALEVAKKM